MLKVERGWQSQSLAQLEQSAPNIVHGRNNSSHSPDFHAARRRSLSSDVYITSPIAATARSAFNMDFDRSLAQHEIASLAPAARISLNARKIHNRRSLNEYRKPPALLRSNLSAQSPDSAPKTPTDTRFASQQVGFSPMLQNQAEMDAVDSLLFMSSPNNSSSMKNRQQQGIIRPGLQRENSGKRVNFLLE
jgi:hypothetical protein